MVSDSNFSLNAFTDNTKNICICSTTSIVLIILFIISPLSNFVKTSLLMKILVVIILFYGIYLNTNQTNSLRNIGVYSNNEKAQSQLSMNIICSYVFTAFMGILLIFVIKSFFNRKSI